MPEAARRHLLPGVLVLLLALATGLAGYLTAGGNDGAGTPVEASAPPVTSLRGTVLALAGDSLRLQTETGEVTLKLVANASFEALQPVSAADIQPGDWVNVGAIRHAQTLFAITAVVVIPAASVSPP